jgi:hypothetical protein
MKKMDSDSIAKESQSKDFIINIPPDLPPAEWPGCCIYRVPKKLRMVRKEAYTPKLVSIGPFHHRGNEFRDIEIHKLRYLKDLLDRTGKSQEDLRKIIEDNEVKIRHCYSEECKLSSKDFVKMILLDAIFIIQLFWKNTYDKKNDYIANKPWLRCGIRHDLILLENQLPFFVLEKLYMFAFNDSSSCNHRKEGKQIDKHRKELKKQDAPFVELSRNYFKCYDRSRKSIVGEEVKHFTDLLRYLFCPPDLEQWCSEEGSLEFKPVKDHTRYCATKLSNTGLEFKAVKDHRRLLEITFPKNGCLGRFPCFDFSCLLACLPCLKCFPCLERMQHILEVPQLVIDDDTEGNFRNLMALEQCHYPQQAYICSYALLLGYLIETEKDVDLLVDKKVIANHLGSNTAVVALINKLGNQIVEDKSCKYYDLVQKQLNKHYDHPLNHILATLTTVYFRDFWRGSTTVVGLVVLGFTLWNFLRPNAMLI